MKRIFLTLGWVFACLLSMAQLQSPEKFLGYKIGTRYTPHYRLVQYFEHVAKEVPKQVKLEKYGETNEGRPLILATIASVENFANLEQIRTNNLRLANALHDHVTPNEKAPAIVWLSYNVHGNETSSSEAAMLTLYELVNPANAKCQAWLKNTVVLIDPCLNPDGRDRYINWYTTVTGKTNNPLRHAREHREPWPGGRSNHYNFDLNRDWAWQTQVESRARIKKYNEWLPQVHVDFHEQGVDEPYYFAPAAEPFHEVITSWQREFQTMIGKNHARYFDQNGWLYFTKERFDLFYPSYGDTYPTYNGAIGMTYEQGGIGAGLGMINADGDTLTLVERTLHHHTTGLSTIEVTSQNAERLVKEFRSYFNNAINNPAGEFKSWLIKNDGTDKINRLKELLNNNKIEWSYSGTANLNGLNYFTGRKEAFKAEKGDLVVNLNQSKANLIKVLFERVSKLSDSATYDITAWSIPFASGLNTYGVNSAIPTGGKDSIVATSPLPNSNHNAYAYAIKWNGMNSVKFLANVLQKGLRVRFAEQPFSSGGENFDKGTLIITKAANSAKAVQSTVETAAQETSTTIYPIKSGFVDKGFDFGSDRVHIINGPKVAMLAGESVSSLNMGEIWHLFDQQLDYPITIMSAEDFLQDGMNQYNVLILPEGNYEFLSKRESNDELKAWVRRGGKIIALESVVSQLAKAEWGIRLKEDTEKKEDEEKKTDYKLLRKYENRQRDDLVKSMPGSIFKVELDNSHPLGFGYPTYYYTLKQDANIYEFLKSGGWNVGFIKKDNFVSGFTGSEIKEKLKDGLLFGVQEMGRGQIVYLADDPIFRSFWENGKLLFCNAVFLVGQ